MSETVSTTTKMPICTMMPKPEVGGHRGGDGADADEREAEVRNRHFDDRGDQRERQPGERRDLGEPAVEESADA